MIVTYDDLADLMTDALWTAQNDADIAAEAYETHDAGEPGAAENAAYLRDRARMARMVSVAISAPGPKREAILDAIAEALR